MKRTFLRLFCKNFRVGARVSEVEEPVFGTKSILFEFEVKEVAEPKALIPQELVQLVSRYGSFIQAAKAIGVSEAFIRQNIKQNDARSR